MTEPAADTGSFTDASDPFSPTSDEINPPDVVVRSSDGVDFHAHKAILSFGSVVFKDMFAFPEPSGESANATRDGKPVVALPESSKTVEKLLILCYPRFTTTYIFRDLDGVDEAYVSAGKYQIPGGQKMIEQLLEDPGFLEKEPHRVFTIACHRGLGTVAKLAAMQTLKMPRYVPNISVPEFKLITAYQLRQLEDFHYRCSESIGELLQEYTFPVEGSYLSYPDQYPEYSAVWWATIGHGMGCGPHEDEGDVFPAKWLRGHIARVREAAVLRPHPDAISKAMSELSSTTLTAMSDCPKCVQLAPGSLGVESFNLQLKATQVYAKVLSQFSFVV
ncbi:hypothetical protein C8F04DRAFT_1038562 [Mycena alexandri]|uniref:BTB domain-containing protein n=1 Tax=Mycena alexandri TaxID=1745969 RepID=A0AAD6X3N9_9AGAR|nr:hypothetical protein C8F04DRAFT_1004514 [Mycena alexandri]KAJ7034415.1 hypothetical protein C8F04DRAFT_1038562 [Mycena alexandri]